MNRKHKEQFGWYGASQRGNPARLMLECLRRQESKRAQIRLDKDIEADVANATAHAIRGLLYQLLGDDRRAEEDFGRVIELEPDNAEARCLRAGVRAQTGEYHLAVEDYDIAIDLDQQNPETYNNRGCALRSWETWTLP